MQFMSILIGQLYSCHHSKMARLFLLALGAASAAATDRKISWWFDVAESTKTDAGNIAAIANHTHLFSRVMPYNGNLTLNGNVSLWWEESGVDAWNKPLQKLGVPVLPYLIDTSNSTEMHLVYDNTTKVVADAVAIAEHYGFQGWFIDYEDEHPVDSDPKKSAKYVPASPRSEKARIRSSGARLDAPAAERPRLNVREGISGRGFKPPLGHALPNFFRRLGAFLTALGDALHAKNMSLTICVASWSGLLADYATIAKSSVDELQLMSTYANPGNSQAIIKDYFAKIKGATGNLDKAGVGMGIYYDGRGGNAKEWDEASARAFIKGMVDQGGSSIDVYRLLEDGSSDWPYESWWWTVFSDFVAGKI